MASTGRPRDPALDARILDAVTEMLAERGVRGLRADDAAARSGVPKSTIYRRWPSLRHLVVEAMAREVGIGEIVPDGDPVLELREIGQRFGRAVAGPRGAALVELAVDVAGEPELAELYRRLLVLPNREIALDLMRRAVEAGDFRAGADLELALDESIGAIFYRVVVLGREVSPTEVDGIVDGLIGRLRAA